MDSIKEDVTSRRSALKKVGAAVSVMAFPTIWTSARAQSKQLVIRDPGGPYSDGFGEAFYKPFKAATGIEIIPVVAQSDPTSLIKGMVESKNYAWDMALLNRQSADVLTDKKTGFYLEEVKVNAPEIPEKFRSQYLIATLVLQSVLAIRTDKFKDRPMPNSWADFFNVKDFPGRRAIRRNPADTLEEAYLATLKRGEAVYPINTQKAFENLSRIKKDVQVWWTGGAQTSQLLKAGEVDMCTTWNARAQTVIDEGAPVKIIWNQGLWSVEGFAILKGTPKADMCREFIKFTCDAQRQALYTKHLSYGPSNPDAYKYIDPVKAKKLPTFPENMASSIQIDGRYWSENKDNLTERFNTWLLS
ncbi:ABC transporter substrate-binding protein [Glaciimonas sp. PCH181]|uniref:ABC transporter substrate-binding protein n=1 Tax=Glaciimonas sp. PCH181 TaxID=2133943 RepID=UPI000D398E5F|nr:ABC transporter substrate-binding protein [Glaciimonas sp. PCH181]PUA19090.1 dehydrogenase [Glaciimonas sp. PCH181]